MQHITTTSLQQEPAEIEKIIFPKGLIGFSEAQEFSIQLVKGIFKLCCMQDPSLSFLALPIEDNTSILEPCDIEQASQACNVPEDEMMILLLITARQDANDLLLTCNLRAPLVVPQLLPAKAGRLDNACKAD